MYKMFCTWQKKRERCALIHCTGYTAAARDERVMHARKRMLRLHEFNYWMFKERALLLYTNYPALNFFNNIIIINNNLNPMFSIISIEYWQAAPSKILNH